MSSRSPRSATHLIHHLDDSSLFKGFRAAKGIQVDPTIPLSEYLWTQTVKYHTQALESAFVQGLKEASLNPEGFGGYMVQDSVFCSKAMESIDTAASRTTDTGLRNFLVARAKSYKTYYVDLFNTWHIEYATGITLGKECTDYVNHEKDVSLTLDPVYFVVAMIPCAKLWPWLGKQLNVDSCEGKFGVYTSWVTENLNPDSTGVVKYEKLINDAETAGHIDRQTALGVYTGSMKGEAGFFSSIKA